MATSKSVGLSDEEKAAARERVRELKAEAKRGTDRAAGEKALLANVAAMPAADRVMAERLHAIVTKNAPELMPKTWYGMPAWANKDGKVVCFFKAASKFDQRYATFAFEEDGKIDDGPNVGNLVGNRETDARGRKEDRRAREEGGELGDGR